MGNVRRTLGGFALAVASVVAIVVPSTMAGATTAPPTLAQKQAILKNELTSVAVFNTMYANRTVAPNNAFDWSTDLCSWSPDKPLGFDFTNPCRRHDFNYRNFKNTGLFNATTKAQIDSAFEADMKAVCSKQSWLKKATCNGIADTYYEAVKKLGT